MSALSALFWLTADLVRRLLREPQVVRSLLWPIALVPITLMFTIFAFVWLEGDWPIAVSADLPAEISDRFLDEGFTLVPVDDPYQAVQRGQFRYGTNGDDLFVTAAQGRALQVERVLREVHQGSWSIGAQPPPATEGSQGRLVTGVIGTLFVLFGVVFGAGMVARDRDDGTLESQLATGTPLWIHGASRLFAGASVLSTYFALAVLVMHAILGIDDLLAILLNGTSACIGGVAIGLLVIGRGGRKNGFSGPLAAGLTLATGLVAVGLALPAVGRFLPIASLVSDNDGLAVLPGSLALILASITLFTYRSARA